MSIQLFSFFWTFSCSAILVRSMEAFISSLLLMSQYMRYIFCNIKQAILGPLCFSLLWLIPDNLSCHSSMFLFVPLVFPLFAYLLNDSTGIPICIIGFNLLKILLLPMPWSTFCRSLAIIIAYLGS